MVGPSGSGKSSLVRAGLVPAIRRGALDRASEPSVAEMFPGVHPLEELEMALLRVAERPAPRLRDALEAGGRGLLDAIDLVVPGPAEVVLVVDQFEEAFTVTANDGERASFLEALRVACVDPGSRITVVITLRADFFDRPLTDQRFGELVAARHVAVPPPTPDELEHAIRGPAERVGVRPEPGLEAALIADFAQQPGGLPLIQYALTELFERRTDSRLTLQSYTEIGGVAGSLSARAERLYRGSGPDWHRAVKQVFLRLVTLGEGTQDTRRRVSRSELGGLDVDPDTVDDVLDRYGRHRLLTFDREPSSRTPTVEIAHEALLGAWQRLASWIDAAREDLRQERRLSQAASEWRGSGHDDSFLLRGGRLEQLHTWTVETDLAIGREARAFLKASLDRREREDNAEEVRRRHEQALERRSRSRLRVLVSVFAVAALVAATLTIVATDQSERAETASRIAHARELAAAANASAGDDPERSLLLAIAAVERTRAVDGTVLPEAEDALHRALFASRIEATIPSFGRRVDWSANGLLASDGMSGTGEHRDPRRRLRGDRADVPGPRRPRHRPGVQLRRHDARHDR